MNKNNIILTATSLALAIGVLSADAKSFKRGVSENAFNLKEEIDVIKPERHGLHVGQRA